MTGRGPERALSAVLVLLAWAVFAFGVGLAFYREVSRPTGVTPTAPLPTWAPAPDPSKE